MYNQTYIVNFVQGSHALSVLHDRGGGQLGTKHYRIVGSEAEGYHITPIRPYATLEEFVEGYLGKRIEPVDYLLINMDAFIHHISCSYI